MKYRYYRNATPEIGEALIAKVIKIDLKFGVYVTLPEYNDAEGFVPLSEYVRRLKTKKIAKIGKEVPCEITRINSDGSFDLTKRRVKEDDIKNAFLRYEISKKLNTLANDIYSLYLDKYGENTVTDEIKESIMKEVVWNVTDQYEKYNMDIYDDVARNMTTFTSSVFDNDFIVDVRQYYSTSIEYKDAHYESKFNLETSDEDGLLRIKDIMDVELKDKEKIICITSPIYEIHIDGVDDEHIQERMIDILSQIEKKCDNNIKFNVIEKNILKKKMSVKYKHRKLID